ncbi:AB hydrolase-1 domain-containing protein [Mycena kentingensis (nom. inval.)]|nr:AB hydrolase-1 domain-containing protein [Mycena kentingensis (nom. inval.)]
MSTLVLFGCIIAMGVILSKFSRRSTATILHFGPQPATLTIRKDGTGLVNASLKDLASSYIPALFIPFKPVWWLPSGHLQTIYCVVGDFSKVDVLQYKRQLLRLTDGGTMYDSRFPCSLRAESPQWARFLHPQTILKFRKTPRSSLYCMGSPEAGSYESYVRSILVPATSPVSEGGLGYRAVVVNFRGCAGVEVTSAQLYSAGYTGDIRTALAYISNRYPRAPLLGIGFSLGANVLTRYLAEEGEQSRLSSGCALACPWDLAKNNDGLRFSFLGRFYSRAMAANLTNLLRRNLGGLSGHPTLAPHIDAVLQMKNALLDEFDDNFTRVAGGAAPDFPFPSAQAYYKWGSSHNVVSQIRVPYLAMNAADDPVVTRVPMDGGGNGMVIMALTPSGGHLGWFQAGTKTPTVRWITKPVLEWMSFVGNTVVHPPRAPARVYLDEDGFMREEGRDGGYKEIEGGGLIEASSWKGIPLKQGL